MAKQKPPTPNPPNPSDEVHRRSRENFYSQQETILSHDIKQAALNKDFEEVERLFNWYAEFLNRHPEALAK